MLEKCNIPAAITGFSSRRTHLCCAGFEGLGSFEPTKQEDMLLFVLNAAISILIIFNKGGFHFDKEIEVVFDCLQNGMGFVKWNQNINFLQWEATGFEGFQVDKIDDKASSYLIHDFRKLISISRQKINQGNLFQTFRQRIDSPKMKWQPTFCSASQHMSVLLSIFHGRSFGAVSRSQGQEQQIVRGHPQNTSGNDRHDQQIQGDFTSNLQAFETHLKSILDLALFLLIFLPANQQEMVIIFII